MKYKDQSDHSDRRNEAMAAAWREMKFSSRADKHDSRPKRLRTRAKIRAREVRTSSEGGEG